MNFIQEQPVREWYMTDFPDDPCGREIRPEVSFLDVYTALREGRDVYDTFGVADSVVRERIFAKLSEMMSIDYDFIYELWLHEGRMC